MASDTNSYRISQFQQWLFQCANISETNSEEYAKKIIESGVVCLLIIIYYHSLCHFLSLLISNGFQL